MLQYLANVEAYVEQRPNQNYICFKVAERINPINDVLQCSDELFYYNNGNYFECSSATENITAIITTSTTPDPTTTTTTAPTTTTTPTPTTPKPAFVSLQNLATLRCLDSGPTGNVYALPCYFATYQHWNVEVDGIFQNRQTGQCLDSNFNGQVYAIPCYYGGYQKWKVGEDGTIQNTVTSLCLDSHPDGNPSPVYTLPCNGGNFQKWIWV